MFGGIRSISRRSLKARYVQGPWVETPTECEPFRLECPNRKIAITTIGKLRVIQIAERQ